MKTIIIQSQLVLLTLVTFPTMFYTSTSDARISRGPAWVAAIDAVNNRRISPTTGVYDPNCDDAKVWDIKLVDKDGDGVPDEDRKPSRLPSAGMVKRGDGSLSTSAFVVGKRHVVTVAHGIAKNGELVPGHDKMYVEIEGCPGEQYAIRRKNLGTKRSTDQSEKFKDFAVLELDRDVCSSAPPLAFGTPPANELADVQLGATGYYEPESISTSSNTELDQAGGTSSSTTGNNGYRQYTSFGGLYRSEVFRDQRVDMYQMGQSKGGSGGPILAHLDGEVVVVGMQFRQPGDGFNYNFSIAAGDGFLDFVRNHVPDLREYNVGVGL